MASIPFGIEFDRIAPPVPTIAAAAEYDAARSRRTIDFFFERLRPRCIGRLQRLDGDPATGRNRRISPVAAHSCDRLLSEPTAGTQPCRREPLFMPLSGRSQGACRSMTR